MRSPTLSVVHAARAMNMAVGIFFLAGVSDFGDFHVEGQCLAGQWMIGVNIHIEAAYLDYGYLHLPLLSL